MMLMIRRSRRASLRGRGRFRTLITSPVVWMAEELAVSAQVLWLVTGCVRASVDTSAACVVVMLSPLRC
jgi:hypothetical protein